MADEEVYYSAKHWAKKSEKFANETKDAKESAETAIALVEGFDTTVEQAKTAITSLATEEKNNIRTVGDEEEASVTNAGTTGVANVKAAETTGVANVNKATSDGVAQIQAEATGFVKTSGDQTIDGVKTFTNGTASVKVSRGDATYGEIMFTKKDGTRTGGFRSISDNNNTTLMYVTSDDGTSIKGNIQVVFDGTTVKTSAPTPPASDNSTQIATTAWVHNNKATIVGWGIPDYSAGVTISTESYTAPSAGLMSVFAFIGSSNVNKQIKVNNNQVGLVYGWGGDWAGTINSFTFPVAKGDVVSGLYTSGTNIFYPFKGVK